MHSTQLNKLWRVYAATLHNEKCFALDCIVPILVSTSRSYLEKWQSYRSWYERRHYHLLRVIVVVVTSDFTDLPVILPNQQQIQNPFTVRT